MRAPNLGGLEVAKHPTLVLTDAANTDATGSITHPSTCRLPSSLCGRQAPLAQSHPPEGLSVPKSLPYSVLEGPHV